MRPLWIPVAIACGVLAVAGVASASVREEARSLAATVAAMTALPDDGSPSPEPSPSGTESPPSETTAPEGNHGETVSDAAKQKETVSRTLPSGKTSAVNHGMYVSGVAHDKAGTSTEAETETGGEGHAKGNAGGNGKGKSGH